MHFSTSAQDTSQAGQSHVDFLSHLERVDFLSHLERVEFQYSRPALSQIPVFLKIVLLFLLLLQEQ
jgi:hypothetical protein